MLILFCSDVNTINQNSYEAVVRKCDFLIRCAACPSCGKSRGMNFHGSYDRQFRSPSAIPEVQKSIRIRRCRCKVCGATHAIFLLTMIPFFRITLPDAVSFFNASDESSIERIAVDLTMDDDSIRFLFRRYSSYWSDKIEMPYRRTLMKLALECFSSFKMWFLQKADMKRKLFISLVPTQRSCDIFPLPLII